MGRVSYGMEIRHESRAVAWLDDTGAVVARFHVSPSGVVGLDAEPGLRASVGDLARFAGAAAGVHVAALAAVFPLDGDTGASLGAPVFAHVFDALHDVCAIAAAAQA